MSGGGRSTKEMLVYAASKRAAIGTLRKKFEAYRLERKLSSWQWMQAPEALQDEATKEWRAYGRIRFTKKAGSE